MYWDCYDLVLPLAASGSYTYIRDVVSQELGNTRDLVIYTPPSYYENPFKPFSDLLIIHDGQHLFNASTLFAGVAWQVRLCYDTVCLLARGSSHYAGMHASLEIAAYILYRTVSLHYLT